MMLTVLVVKACSDPRVCLNGGTCTVNVSMPEVRVCLCAPGYGGDTCQSLFQRFILDELSNKY